MRPEDFTADSPGEMVAISSANGEAGWAYIPYPLPPSIVMDAELTVLHDRAVHALGILNGLGRMLPNPRLLIRPFVRREALASSRIEGTRAEYDQLILHEVVHSEAAIQPDVQEVVNYMQALDAGWNRPSGRPISVSLIRELHQQLMSGVRGATKHPGSLRSALVLIGGPHDDLLRARFVPPPASQIHALLEDLSRFISEPSHLPALVRLALAHYQFETIHPFEDGNGRLGRLLMPLMLETWGLMEQPLLYLSEYFEQHRDAYIDHLYAVSQRGAWNEWIAFTLNAVRTQALDAVERGQALLQLREDYRARYQRGRSARVLLILDRLFELPTITVTDAATAAGVTFKAASRNVEQLVSDGILVEWTGQRRNRVYLATGILATILGRNEAQPSDVA